MFCHTVLVSGGTTKGGPEGAEAIPKKVAAPFWPDSFTLFSFQAFN